MERQTRATRNCSAGPADRGSADRGSASLEFLGAALLLLVPIVYLVITLGELQAAAFAVDGAARHAARVAVLGGEADPRRSAEAVVDLVLDDFGRSGDERRVSIDCGGGGCAAPGTRVRVTVQLDVRLPFAPPVLGLDQMLVVPVEASAVQPVSRWVSPEDAR
ncbi:TadE family protein [Agromyces mediolanus]|uniref:TadE family protein n=1 Tax=Agromyces mediolanus TaxID=41986 RepID=UPI003833CEB8